MVFFFDTESWAKSFSFTQ